MVSEKSENTGRQILSKTDGIGGVRSEAIVKQHVGPVAYGKVGESWNLFGHAVNIAAVMELHGFAMSPQVFRKLKPETRELFK